MSESTLTENANHIRLSSKGQLVIPRRVRESLNWQSGMELTVVKSGQGVLIQPVVKKTGQRLESLRRCLVSNGVVLSDDELCAPVDLNQNDSGVTQDP